MTMADLHVVQDWTNSQSQLSGDQPCALQYRVIRVEGTYRQEIRTVAGKSIGAIDLPDGIVLDRQSYEVMLQYALSQLAA